MYCLDSIKCSENTKCNLNKLSAWIITCVIKINDVAYFLIIQLTTCCTLIIVGLCVISFKMCLIKPQNTYIMLLNVSCLFNHFNNRITIIHTNKILWFYICGIQ